jgi:hypothetical protein
MSAMRPEVKAGPMLRKRRPLRAAELMPPVAVESVDVVAETDALVAGRTAGRLCATLIIGTLMNNNARRSRDMGEWGKWKTMGARTPPGPIRGE